MGKGVFDAMLASALVLVLQSASAAPMPMPASAADRLLPMLLDLAPDATPEALELAARAFSCARRQGMLASESTLGVIDYSLPSSAKRLWVFDIDKRRLLFEEWVAHGRNSGGEVAHAFSNVSGSLMSSIGAFVTAGTYSGHNGYSLRLRGLESGINDNALERAIVMHGAPYVNPALAMVQGRLGRSFGCPAVRPQVARPLIDAVQGGSLLFAYFPDASWIASSDLLNDCGGERSAAAAAVGAAAPARR